MSIFIKKDKKRAALEKEYASVLKKETQLKQSAMKTTAPRWKTDLDIADPADEIIALAVVLTIDAVTESKGGVSVSVSSN